MFDDDDTEIMPGDFIFHPQHLPKALVDSMTPQHATPIQRKLVRLTLWSLALQPDEKHNVLSMLHNNALSEYQVEQLVLVFHDEAEQWADLRDENRETLKLQAISLVQTFALAAFWGCGYQNKALETAVIRRMVRNRARHSMLRPLLQQLPDDFWAEHPAVAYLYRHAFAVGHPSWLQDPHGGDHSPGDFI